MRALAFAAIIGCAFSVGTSSAQRPLLVQDQFQDSATSVGGFVESWQQRILNENLPVAEPKTWALRNMPKFASFSAERFELARQVTDIQELEAMLVSAPIASGTGLGLLMANPPGNVALNAVAKSDPGSSPTTYSDLEFTMVNPCRIYDSRVSQGGAGPWVNGTPRVVRIGPYPAAGGGYATGNGAQGGSATGCGLDALAAGSDIKAVMMAVSTVNQTTNGYLTFYPATLADPSLTVVSMWYRSGNIQTSFVVSPTDSVAPVWVRGVSRQANTEVIIDIVGYFAKAPSVALDCTTVGGAAVAAAAGSTNTYAAAPACAAGYSRVSFGCSTSSNNTLLLGLVDGCFFNNAGGGAASVSAISNCCRIPGR
jgi:hypothetical protein